MQDVLARSASVDPDELSSSNAATVRQSVTESYLRTRNRIVQFEIGQIFRDEIVVAHLAV